MPDTPIPLPRDEDAEAQRRRLEDLKREYTPDEELPRDTGAQ